MLRPLNIGVRENLAATWLTILPVSVYKAKVAPIKLAYPDTAHYIPENVKYNPDQEDNNRLKCV